MATKIRNLSVKELARFQVYGGSSASPWFTPIGGLYRKDTDSLGILLRCTTDRDFNYVGLQRDGGQFRAVDTGTSFATSDEAETRLRKWFASTG